MPTFLWQRWPGICFSFDRACRELMACEEQVHELPNALSPLGCGLNGLDTLLLSINVEKDYSYKTFSSYSPHSVTCTVLLCLTGCQKTLLYFKTVCSFRLQDEFVFEVSGQCRYLNLMFEKQHYRVVLKRVTTL